MELMHTDLPDPVVPAMSRCGIFAISMTWLSPVMSLPSATDRLLSDCWNSLLASTSRSATIWTFLFGTSMPTATFSGMGAMRTEDAPSASAMSSDSAVSLENFVPRSICSSYRVTDGPRTMLMICASIEKDFSVSTRRSELSVSSFFAEPRTRGASSSRSSSGIGYRYSGTTICDACSRSFATSSAQSSADSSAAAVGYSGCSSGSSGSSGMSRLSISSPSDGRSGSGCTGTSAACAATATGSASGSGISSSSGS